ncbi:hypothetical protein DSO57_1025210 [Entomophthora muscae]|uniref:Uncharacterized protein n=1 Tax=Entomophthora muscae TaxID=34485 RepID=A0ACC2S4C0_9FUNG|nr:hypothetical protein DSO57_1025210 [Entomophthora muscae]
MKYTHFKFGVVYDLPNFFTMMKCMPFHAQEFYVVANAYCSKYPCLDLDLNASHFATLPSLNEVESVKDNVTTVFSSMAQKKIFVSVLHCSLCDLPENSGAFWRLSQEPDLSVYKSSQAFLLLEASKNDSSLFCLQFAQDHNYNPTIEEMMYSFPLVLYDFSSISPPQSQGSQVLLSFGPTQGQDPLPKDFAWLSEIGKGFGSLQEPSTVSADRLLVHGVSQGHQSISSGIPSGAGILPVVLTPSRALQMNNSPSIP